MIYVENLLYLWEIPEGILSDVLGFQSAEIMKGKEAELTEMSLYIDDLLFSQSGI